MHIPGMKVFNGAFHIWIGWTNNNPFEPKRQSKLLLPAIMRIH